MARRIPDHHDPAALAADAEEARLAAACARLLAGPPDDPGTRIQPQVGPDGHLVTRQWFEYEADPTTCCTYDGRVKEPRTHTFIETIEYVPMQGEIVRTYRDGQLWGKPELRRDRLPIVEGGAQVSRRRWW